MKHEILLLGRTRELAGLETTTVELPEVATVGMVRAELEQRHPELGPLLPSCAIAVDHRYLDDRSTLGPPGVEIALVPPVSGG
jgi:molybdopterin converting factor small subunit